MGYRRIYVDKKKYEYVVGKTHTKVVGVGVFKNCERGTEIVNPDYSHLGYIITSKIVRKFIQGEPFEPELQKCEHGTVTDKLMVDPYSEEIYNDTIYIIACEKCYNSLADEI